MLRLTRRTFRAFTQTQPSLRPCTSSVSIIRSFSDNNTGADSDSELYDPYKEYEKATGDVTYRTIDALKEESDDIFIWAEPEDVMQDKSWPQTTGNEYLDEFYNLPEKPLEKRKMDLVLQEVFRRIQHPKSIDDIKVPQMDVDIPQDNPDREQLEQMKLALINNGHLSMDDKNEILLALIDELANSRADPTPIFDLDELESYKKDLLLQEQEVEEEEEEDDDDDDDEDDDEEEYSGEYEAQYDLENIIKNTNPPKL
uniref:AlNc14C160G7761 protein n=1 Tax=Albugo laibachii Nc14 TaxID=890382 RepID=F0WMS5_9STRA|nr:AlNc14C160G7761 [Albugo laibachii Nc14]|eukprot:CCA22610.1 AlNc14C160G7761 [Albugo laibachii Nc14]